MKRVLWLGYFMALGGLILLGYLGEALAEETAPAPQTETKSSDVEQKIDVLAQEVEKLKAGQDLFPPLTDGKYGFSPAASKVYSSKGGVSLGGYGEFLYSNFADEAESGVPSGKKDTLDAVKAILYTGYKFNPSILFNSEIEFEHGSTESAGSVSVEFAYLDFLWKDPLNFRAGLLLMPVGFTNELHEPTVYLGALRPLTEKRIIPNTWSEPGVGLFGEAFDFHYRAYVTTGFDGVGGGASNATGFSDEGFGEARQKGSKASAEGLAFVARADYTGVPGLSIGASSYFGNSGQDNQTPAGDSISAVTSLTDVHADYRWKGLQIRGLLAYAHVSQADRINAAKGLTGADSIGEALLGYYLEVGYDVFRFMKTEQQLIPFFRCETLNTQFRVPAGFAKNPSNERTVTTLGASYKPIVNIVVKADYEFHRNEANSGVDQFNIGLGYLF